MALNLAETQRLLSAIVHEVYQRAYTPDFDGVDVELWIDPDTNNYGVWFFGWDVSGQVLTPNIHMRIRQGKIYIEENVSDIDVLDRLISAGINPDQIVLAYQHPSERAFFEFATA
jgi:hypothetical protein